MGGRQDGEAGRAVGTLRSRVVRPMENRDRATLPDELAYAVGEFGAPPAATDEAQLKVEAAAPSASDADSTARWFLRGSKLPTTSTMGRLPRGAELVRPGRPGEVGSMHSTTVGPLSPWVGSVSTKPWNSTVAEALMPATTHACLITLRYLTKRLESAVGTRSALTTGMKSYPIATRVFPELVARGARRSGALSNGTSASTMTQCQGTRSGVSPASSSGGSLPARSSSPAPSVARTG